MKKLLSFVVAVLLTVSVVGTSAFACGSSKKPDDKKDKEEETVYTQLTSEELKLQFATGVVAGTKREDIDLSRYESRLIPENALGEFDGVKSSAGGDSKIFSTVAYDKTLFTFDDEDQENEFYNVSDSFDLKLNEITWSDPWYIEGVQIYLKDAYILKDGKIVKYEGNDNGLGYFAGIAWNREGVADLSEETRMAYADSIVSGRSYIASNAWTEGNYTYTEFNFPEEVVKASGIYVVDMYGLIEENTDPESSYYNKYRSLPGGYDLDGLCVYVKEKTEVVEETKPCDQGKHNDCHKKDKCDKDKKVDKCNKDKKYDKCGNIIKTNCFNWCFKYWIF